MQSKKTIGKKRILFDRLDPEDPITEVNVCLTDLINAAVKCRDEVSSLEYSDKKTDAKHLKNKANRVFELADLWRRRTKDLYTEVNAKKRSNHPGNAHVLHQHRAEQEKK